MGDDHIVDLSSAGAVQPYKKDAAQPSWKRLINIPNALFAVSIILILVYFFTLPTPQPTVNSNVVIDAPSKPKLLEVYFFYDSSDCSRCIEGLEFMKGLKKKYSKINLLAYEVSFDPENKEKLRSFIDEYSIDSNSPLPLTFIDEKAFIGFSNGIGSDIDNYVSSK